jgi:hypothetical protein
VCQVLAAGSMKMYVFWNVTPRSLVEIYRYFRDTDFLIAEVYTVCFVVLVYHIQ